MDVVRKIQAFNAGRDPERLQLKYRAMRGSTFAFLRGSCHLFYDRLPRSGIFATAPAAWICGDLHLENFGSYKADNRLVHFDMNDFDEAALAPASWDLVRLLASVFVASRGVGVGGAEARRLGRVLLEAYAGALAAGKAYWVERDTARGLVRQLLDGLRERQRPPFLDTRTRLKGRRRFLRVDGRKALAASDVQRARVAEFMAGFVAPRPDAPFYEVLDVARRIAGTGSLGIERYVVLVRGKGSPDGNYLLDLKEARPSALAPRLQLKQPAWGNQAHRIVELQRRVQAVSMAFLHPVEMGRRAFVLRGLQPSEDRVALRRGRPIGEWEDLLGTLGRIVAWAHLRGTGRQGSAIADELVDWGRREKWRQKLLAASAQCADDVRRDSATFAAAFDDGAFRP